MIDINLFRADRGGNPDGVRESQRKRGASIEVVDEIIALDRDWIKCKKKSIAEQMKSGEKDGLDSLLAEKNRLEQEKKNVETAMEGKARMRDVKLNAVGNIVHESVPTSSNEDENGVVRFWHGESGETPKKGQGLLSHDQVLQRLDGYEPERGTKVVGHRGYFLKNWGVRLNLALIQYGLDFLSKREYTLLQTPFLMNKEMMMKTAQLEDFDEQLFKVIGGDGEDKYLIATSEQPISAMHADEWFEKPSEMLPLRYGGISTCFRKEAGSHGKDTWGIFRVHQFEKVEQFVLTEPEKSWEMLEEMIEVSEDFYKSFKIPYRLVTIVSGVLNNAAAKKYDLEAWFPSFGQYKELVSCSNCTDYQSRAMEIRCGMKKMGDREKKYVHCLNSTLTATERTLCCILENYQKPDGLVVPDVLRPYLGGTDFIPYTVPLKKKNWD